MFEKYFNINEQGLSVRCKLYCDKPDRTFDNIAIATYGFGGNKDNRAVEKFADRICAKYKSYAVLTFDWPAHGNDGRKKLSVPESMDYLSLACDYARGELGARHLYMYATSYGGYVVLRYLIEVGDPFDKIALRCPGINLHDVMLANMSEDEREALARGKKVLKGYDRQMELDQEFFDDLAAHDIRAYEYFDHADKIKVFHGTLDEQVPIEESEKFCDDNVIEFVPVEHADHPFSNPSTMDFAIGEIIKFLAPE